METIFNKDKQELTIISCKKNQINADF